MLRAGLLVAALTLALPVLPVSHNDARPVHAVTNCDTSSDGLDAQEIEMIGLVNAARAQVGLGALAVSPTLNRMAAWKSEDSSASGPSFSHTDSLGRSPFQRAIDCGYPSGAAENIAYGYSSAQATFNAWMQSPGHRANILNSSYVAMGVGRSGSAWTLNFGFTDDSGSPAPAPQPTDTPTSVPSPTNPPVPTSTPHPTSTPLPAFPAAAQPAATFTPVVVSQPAAPLPTATPSPTARASIPDTRQMSQGINMVTYSGPTQPVAEALHSIDSEVKWVYTWDGIRWLRYVPGMPPYINTLTHLRQGTTYIVALEHDALWVY